MRLVALARSLALATLVALVLGAPTRARAEEADEDVDEAPASYFEGGFGYGTSSGGGDSQWFVDGILWRQRHALGKRARIHFDNILSLVSPSSDRLTAQNTAQLLSGYRLEQATPNTGQMVLANVRASLEVPIGSRVTLEVGHMRVPLGIEGTYDRYRWATYYYSQAYLRAQQLRWHYDLGARGSLDLKSAGNLELGIFDGRTPEYPLAGTPAFAARYRVPVLQGELFAFEPVFSTRLGRFEKNDPTDVAVTAGAIARVGAVWLDGEWFMANRRDGAKKSEQWSGMLAPGIDLGFLEMAGQYSYGWHRVGGEAGRTNHQAGLTVGKTIDNEFRVRVAYLCSDLGGSSPMHDVRLLFGGQF